MKNVISYIFIIIALLLLGVNGVAAQEKDCPFTVNAEGNNKDITYGDKVLTIRSSDKVTITGDGKVTDWGIVLESLGGYFEVTIRDLNIERNGVPLEIKGSQAPSAIKLEGTNRFISTAASGSSGILSGSGLSISGDGTLTVEGSLGEPGIDGYNLDIVGGIIHAKGGKGAPGIGVNNPDEEGMQLYLYGGSVTAIGGEGAVAIDCGTATNRPQIQDAFVLAINGTDAESIIRENGYKNGLVIQGKQLSNGTIEQTSSTLKGNITLTNDAEIPAWSTVTIPAGQTVTIPAGKTLTNNGTIENNGTLTNNGTFKGKLGVNQPLNIGGNEGFDVTCTGGEVTFNYEKEKKQLTIDETRSSEVLIKGRKKDHAVECGIVIAQEADIRLTIEDLNIEAGEALVYNRTSDGSKWAYNLFLHGANRLTSTGGPGINLNGGYISFWGSGSLTVTGGDDAAGIQASSLYINENTFVVAIGGKGATSGISGSPDLNSGLLIQGSLQSDGTILQTSSGLSDNFTLGGDAEIPAWATVTIAAEQTFTIENGKTLTNNGTIENNGSLTNSGTLTNNGSIYNKGTLTGNHVNGQLYHYITFNANYPVSPDVDERYILQDNALDGNIFTRSGYTFQGWFTTSDGGTKVETSTEPQILYAHWKAVPVPELAPTVYYTVTLPLVEGAVTDPVAGDYEVESWSTFRFYLTLDTAYNQSQPVVTTSRGETLQPRTSDGAYLVKYVRTDVEIFIDGIEKNPPPVANEPIRAAAPEPEIWSENACLCIRLPEGLPSSPVRIFTPEGRLLDSFGSVPGLNRRQLPTGIYIVQVGATVRKVAIR